MSKNVLVATPRWRDFIVQLEARMDFQQYGPGDADWEWRCGKNGDKFGLTREVLTELGIEPQPAIDEIRATTHRCCDCEIIFNEPDDRATNLQ